MSRRNRSLVLGLALLLGVVMIAPASALGSDGSLQPREVTNDNFGAAWAIGGGSGVTGHVNDGATTQAGEWLGPCEGYYFGATTWYSMTVTQNSQVTVNTRGADFDTALAVYTGSSLASLTQRACDDDISGTDYDSEVQFAAAPGVTYWIQVGGTGGVTGTYPVNITRTPTGPAGPTNDDFGAAWAIGGGSGVTGHVNGGATTQAGEWLGPCEGLYFGATTWYSMTVTQNSQVTVNTRGANFDTVLAVYTGSSLASLTRRACDDDISGTDYDSEVQFAAAPGVTYWIQVGGLGGETGAYPVNITRTPTGPAGPTNDDFGAAWAIGGGSGVTGHVNGGATTQAGEWLGPCEGLYFGATTWYSMTVTQNSQVTVNTRGANFDTVLAVYTGSSLASLTRRACDDDISGTDYDSEVQFAAAPGVTYWIQVGGLGGETGAYPVNITRTPTGGGFVCQGEAATRVGTAGANTIYGTAGRDVIVALGGNDLIYGYGGNDVICAGPGADTVYGGAGADRLYGAGGNDRLYGAGGNDSLFGGGGSDWLFGQAGFDTLQGGPGADTCQTGEIGAC